MPGWVGRTLGKASVELLLAHDEAAEVYLGRHRGLQRAVAIKIYDQPVATDPTVFAEFQRDARALAGLHNPHIAGVIESGRADGYLYLILDYVPGTSLAAHLNALTNSQRTFNAEQIARLLGDVAEGLDFAHQRGVIHGELQPSSILLTSASAPVEAGKALPSDFQAVVTDFAVAGPLAASTNRTTPLSAAYMSPEQASGKTPGAQADVYSLGIIIYELTSGHVPFSADSAEAVLQLHQIQDPPAIDGVSAGIQDVLRRALAKDPSRRFAKASELATAYGAAITRSVQAEAAEPAAKKNKDSVSPLASPHGVRNWTSTAVVGVAILGLVAILSSRILFPIKPAPAAQSTAPAEPTESSAEYATAVGDPIGLLRFQDGAALVDEVTFNATAMPALAPGTQYEIWLLDATGEERRSVGYLKPNPDGTSSTSLVDPQGRNLLSLYDSVEITVEPDPDPSPNPAGDPVYSVNLPEEGLLHVRHLLVSFSKAPNAIGLLDGLVADTQLLDDTARSMLNKYEAGDEPATRAEAESMLNILVGSRSPDHADWNQDGQIADPGDGFGLLLNGDNSGYIQGSIAHAEFAASSPTATSNMQSHGNHVIVSARNLEAWAPQLRDLLKQILTSPFDTTMGGQIRQAVALSQNMLAGTDLNGDERIEAIAGEGGAETAYQHALYMADIVITHR